MASNHPRVSRYPGGFRHGVEVLGTPVLNTYAGEVRWVNSAKGSDGNDGSRGRPWATLAKAITNTASNGGDLIMVMPNHTETLTDTLAVDTTGVTIQGMGQGGQRPNFTLAGAATDGFHVNVADVTIDNITITAGLANLVNAVAVDSTNCTLSNIEFVEDTTHLHFIHAITAGSTTDNTVDGLSVVGCEYHTATDGNTAFMNVIGDIKNMRVVNNDYTVGPLADATGILIQGTAGDDMQAAKIIGNNFSVTTTATDTYVLVSGNDQTDNSGVVIGNRIGTALAATNATNNTLMKGTGFRYLDNYIANDITSGGTLIPTAT